MTIGMREISYEEALKMFDKGLMDVFEINISPHNAESLVVDRESIKPELEYGTELG